MGLYDTESPSDLYGTGTARQTPEAAPPPPVSPTILLWRFIMANTAEFRQFFCLFWADWRLRMISGLSLVCPIASVVFSLFRAHFPELLLLGVSALGLIISSYLVWRGEHRRLLILRLQDLLVRLDRARRTWKQHEHDSSKRNIAYFLFSGTPELEWDAKVPEYKAKMLTAQAFYDYGSATIEAYEALGDSSYTPLSLLLMNSSARGAINGNQLDELIRNDEKIINARIKEVEAFGLSRRQSLS